MPFTVQDLATEAAIMAGIVAVGETLEGSQANYYLNKVNQLADQWATQRLAIYRTQRTSNFALVVGTQIYTIGTGATWSIARPLWIDGAGIIVDPNASRPVELGMQILTTREYQQITVKTTRSSLPRSLWYDHLYNASGYGQIYVYPVPSSATPAVVLYLPIAVPDTFALADTIALPPGYRMALISNLAMLMCLGMRNPPPGVAELAATSFGNLKTANVASQMDAMRCDEGVLKLNGGTGGAFNWLDGGIR